MTTDHFLLVPRTQRGTSAANLGPILLCMGLFSRFCVQALRYTAPYRVEDARERAYERVEDTRERAYERVEDARERAYERVEDARERAYEALRQVRDTRSLVLRGDSIQLQAIML